MAAPYLDELSQDGDRDLKGGLSAHIEPDGRMQPRQVIGGEAISCQGGKTFCHPASIAHYAQVTQRVAPQPLHSGHVKAVGDAHQDHKRRGGEIGGQKSLDRIIVAHNGGGASVALRGSTAGIIDQRDSKPGATGQFTKHLCHERRSQDDEPLWWVHHVDEGPAARGFPVHRTSGRGDRFQGRFKHGFFHIADQDTLPHERWLARPIGISVAPQRRDQYGTLSAAESRAYLLQGFWSEVAKGLYE
jgi:hypothetical protein